MNSKAEKLKAMLYTQRLYFDGAMGTVLMEGGLKPDETPETMTLTDPRRIIDIHKAYLAAGCNIVTTNTFGVNRDKLENYEEYIKAAIECAKCAIAESGRDDCFTAFDIGPTGRLMQPMGDLSFDEAVDLFGSNAALAEKYGADLILIETMTVLDESKAAVTAALQYSSLPVFATNAYGENMRLMTGEPLWRVVKELEALGVSALGVNCSVGPDKTLPIAKELVSCATVPVIVSPNAGMPILRDGKAEYDIDPECFAEYMKEIAKTGACVLGGCCGTTPQYIRAMIDKVAEVAYEVPCRDGEGAQQKADCEPATVGGKQLAKAGATVGEQEQENDEKSALYEAIACGETLSAEAAAKQLLLTAEPIDIINGCIIPTLGSVGADFARGELFLPELMGSAEAAAAAFDIIKEAMPKTEDSCDKSIILATVKGDVHDIGKNIVKVLLESYGFKVYDLGIDVASEKILQTVCDTQCKLVGLSALMTTTVPAMTAAVQQLHESDKDIRVIAGGAVLTHELAENMGADFFAADAMATVNHAREYYNEI